MHIVIKKQESARWFSYWVGRFDNMWEAAGRLSYSEIGQHGDHEESQPQII
jgi:hypothetical protein